MDTPSLEAGEVLAAKGATAPRISIDSLKGKIAFAHTMNLGVASRAVSGMTEQESNSALNLVTICAIVTVHGAVVIGQSMVASPENFDQEKGNTFAYEDAIRQLQKLEGYALRDRLFSQPQG